MTSDIPGAAACWRGGGETGPGPMPAPLAQAGPSLSEVVRGHASKPAPPAGARLVGPCFVEMAANGT